MDNIQEVLYYIQKKLKAPKNQYNNFGRYNYRSCEDILLGLKEVMPEGASVVVSDEVVQIGDRYYIRATATLHFKDSCIKADGWAREAKDKKGMDESQLTGATSSYARKYALNGLFCIDDNKDADAQEPPKESKPQPKTMESLAEHENPNDLEHKPLQSVAENIRVIQQFAKESDLEGARAFGSKMPKDMKIKVFDALPIAIKEWLRS